MSRLWGAVAALAAAVWLLPGVAAAFAQDPAPKVGHEFSGVKLGMKAGPGHPEPASPERRREARKSTAQRGADSLYRLLRRERREVRRSARSYEPEERAGVEGRRRRRRSDAERERSKSARRRALGAEKLWVLMYREQGRLGDDDHESVGRELSAFSFQLSARRDPVWLRADRPSLGPLARELHARHRALEFDGRAFEVSPSARSARSRSAPSRARCALA